VRAEAQRTGKPMAAIIETLVREKLAPCTPPRARSGL
jgi:hypothetical protein